MRISLKVFWNLALIFFIFILVGFSFAGGVGAGYFASLVKDESIRSYDDMRKDIYNYEETTDLYFADNVYLGKLRTDLDREEINLEDVSDYLKKAVISTEDEYFYEHSGVVPKAILRAVLQEFTNSTYKSGGSTLTQQLIKNQILTNEVSFERKAKEILLALRLERFFDKDEILEAYLNVVPFGRNSSGRNIAGVQTAATGIFDVDARDLNLPQAAYIAGLPQSPFAYTPFNQRGEIKEDIEAGLNRMETVLKRMYSAGYITKSEYDEALEYDIRSNLAPPKASPLQNYPWLTFEIEKRAIEEMTYVLAEQDGYMKEDLDNDDKLYNEYHIKADRDLRRNGYKIYTTIDKEIYDKMQEIKNNYEYYGNDKPETIIDPETGEEKRILEPVETGAVLIDNASGRIISFVGGRDYKREQLNHATVGKRSNGSTMKPLAVYTPALEMGAIHPGSPVADVPLEIKAGTSVWKPGNYSNNFHGFLTARYALARSYNIPAARVYADIIQDQPINYLEQMGVTSLTEGDHHHLSVSLGGLEDGVTVEENVNAYATLGNYGEFIDAYMIEKIESNTGEVVYQNHNEPVRVFSPQTSYLSIDMMRDVISHGTAAGLKNRLNFQSDWSGKTGTSQNYRDAWFVATNPRITFGVWMGYDTPKQLERSYKGLSYSQRNLKLWADLLNATYELAPDIVGKDETFKMPGGIVRRSYCSVSGLLPSSLCQEAGLVRTDLFNAKYIPKEEDNSLLKGEYYALNGKSYPVTEQTPKDFVKEGIMISQEFLEEKGLDNLEDLNTLIPNQSNWENITILEEESVPDTNGVPFKITNVYLEGNMLTWSKHADPDILGYRIYKSPDPFSTPTQVATIVPKADAISPFSYKVDDLNIVYQVAAVDVAGNESPLSDKISGAVWDDESPNIPNPFEEPGNSSEIPDPFNEPDDSPSNPDSSENNNDNSEPGNSDNEDNNETEPTNENTDNSTPDTNEEEESTEDPVQDFINN